ncbi:HTH-type transcriptional regulator BetI [Methylobacterium crusticola]|uniref:HTH-type transcriptional regulator BetI n=1 Tax=Methylobacterium crusticola TaxID=1697972 RepID=A0ABQ4QRP0_9HYPH|nr:TetR/AcrR family transcriptional regulator [Methylobacterium crusticola]GJD47867.1 HTH-type transcriptional regulator BetI [Methylobacterium crusticola]
MPAPAPALVVEAGTGAGRRERILDAAEACFIRGGFHRTTMQDIARAAAMSAPNIYRYFASKEDLVLSLADREVRRADEQIAALEDGGNVKDALIYIIRHHFIEITAEKAVLHVEMWAEMTCNPVLGAMHQDLQQRSAAWFVAALARLATVEGFDARALYETIDPLMKGIVVNRALVRGYDPEPAFARLVSLIDERLTGIP